MTLDGKIATAAGESKWITGGQARACGMKLRRESDAILVGINTILADNPSLTFRKRKAESGKRKTKQLRRIVLDSQARTPLTSKVMKDKHAALTTVVVGKRAPGSRVAALAKRVNVLVAPLKPSTIRNPQSQIDLRWLLKKLGVGECHQPAGGRRRRGERFVSARRFRPARRLFLRAENPGRARCAQGGCRGRRQKPRGSDSTSRCQMAAVGFRLAADGANCSITALPFLKLGT